MKSIKCYKFMIKYIIQKNRYKQFKYMNNKIQINYNNKLAKLQVKFIILKRKSKIFYNYHNQTVNYKMKKLRIKKRINE